jgi:1-acyl-sn-glycerol-3-phosphate acyltransferase
MDTPRISRPVLTFFRRIVRGYFRRHFHAVRISGADRFSGLKDAPEPLIVYGNHGSWWDPMVAFLLADRLMRGRQHFAPMDAEALERYKILKQVGIFPVEIKTGRGAVQFLRTSEAIVRGGGVLWITPQGKFVDGRVRPLEFMPGLATLAVRLAEQTGACRVLPLAIEYTYWDERLPECLLHMEEALLMKPGDTAGGVEARLIAALEKGMDQLKAMAIARDPSLFETMARGMVGVGGFYSMSQRMKAALLRRPYLAEHTLPPTAGEASKEC